MSDDMARCDLLDFSKLNIRDGVIHYALFQQDGSMQPMTCADHRSNRLYVAWMQIHDRNQTLNAVE